MKSVTVNYIMLRHPCEEYTKERVIELFAGKESMTALDVCGLSIPHKHILWTILDPALLEEYELWETTIRFAKDDLHNWENWAKVNEPELINIPRNAIETKIKWLNGKASDEELSTAKKEICNALRVVAGDSWDNVYGAPRNVKAQLAAFYAREIVVKDAVAAAWSTSDIYTWRNATPVNEDNNRAQRQVEIVVDFLTEIRHLIQNKPLEEIKRRQDMSGADLSCADLSENNLCGVHLDGANLTRARLRETNLSYSKLSGACLDWAFLFKADLSYSDLSGASLSHANLCAANLSSSNLTGADLSWAGLDNTNLSDARRSEQDPEIPGWKIVDGLLKCDTTSFAQFRRY